MQHELDILIISADDALETFLQKIVSREALNIRIRRVGSLTEILEDIPDIVFYALDPSLFRQARNFYSRAMFVLCAKADQVPECAQDGRAVDDLWLAPLDPVVAGFRFFSLLERAEAKRRSEFIGVAFDTTINSIPDLVWLKDAKGVHIKVNNAFCECVGKTRDNVEGFEHYHIWGISEEEYKNSDYVCVDTEEIVVKSKKAGVFDEMVKGVNGLRQFKTYKSPLLDPHGELIGTVGVARDVTDLRNIDAKLTIVLNSMPFALTITDENGAVIHANPKFEETFGVSSKRLLGKRVNIDDIVHIKAAVSLSGTNDRELTIVTPKKAESVFVSHKDTIYDIFKNTVGYIDIYLDVTTAREMERSLKEMAFTDALTGLSTRRYLFDYMEKSKISEQISLMYLDLDNFKEINDAYGHEEGDNVLKIVAAILRQNFPGEIVVRLGGDEFLIVLIGACESDALRDRANQLIVDLAAAFSKTDHAKSVTASIGVAVAPAAMTPSFDQLLRESDLALYQAKNNGKRQMAFYGTIS